MCHICYGTFDLGDRAYFLEVICTHQISAEPSMLGVCSGSVQSLDAIGCWCHKVYTISQIGFQSIDIQIAAQRVQALVEDGESVTASR